MEIGAETYPGRIAGPATPTRATPGHSLRETGILGVGGIHDDRDAEASRAGLVGVVLMSLLLPGAGHIKTGSWQTGLIVLSVAQLFVLGLRGVPHLMGPTRNAVLLETGLGLGLLGLALCATVHAAWLASRKEVENETAGRGVPTYVPLPLDVRVRQAGPALWTADKAPGSPVPWFTAACLIAAGATGAALLTSKWGLVTVPGPAMGPGLVTGDRLLVDLHRVGLLPRRGEVVILRSHDEDQPFVLRRVIGVPGDRLVVRRRTLMLNGNRLLREATPERFEVDGVKSPVGRETLPLVEGYRVISDINTVADDETRLIVVPPGEVFVMRDDRATPVSAAGSVSGLASVSEVDGVATTKLWFRFGALLPWWK